MKKEQYIKKITAAAKLYKQNLSGYTYLFISSTINGQYRYMEVAFHPRNFMHLVGASSATLSSVAFFDACLNNKLSPRDLIIENESQTKMKLDVIDELMKLPWTAKMIGDYNGNGNYLYTEKIAGNIRGCMGFVEQQNFLYYLPNTVLKSDIRQNVSTAFPIAAIYRKSINDASYPAEPLVISKNLRDKQLIWPEEVAKRIKNTAPSLATS